MSANKRSTPSTWVDPDDAPALTAADLERATATIAGRVVTREELRDAVAKRPRGRPVGSTKADAKEPVKLRLDADVVAALRATGDGWQTRINDTLRANLVLAGRL